MPSTASEASPDPKPLRLSHGLIALAGGAACGCLLAELAGFPEMGRAILTPSTQAALPDCSTGVWAAAGAAAAGVLWILEALRLARRAHLDTLEALRRDAFSFAPLLAFYLVYLIYIDKSLTPSLIYYPFFLIPLALALSLAWKLCLAPAHAFDRARARCALGVAVGVFAAVFVTLNFLQIRSVNVPFTDSGYFERMMWNMCHGNVLHACEHEHIFLGTRVRFVQFLLVPIYAVWPCLETLTFVQIVAVALAAWPVFLLSVKVLKDDRLALACALGYLLHPGTQYLVGDASGEIVRLGTLGMPAALLALLWVEERRYGLASVAFAFTLTCREEYALVLAAAGLYVMFRQRCSAGAREAWFGPCFVGVGAAWFVLALFVVIPHFSGTCFGGFKYYDFNQGLAGPHAGPGRVLATLFSQEKVGFLLLLVVPLCLFPLFGPIRLLLALPAVMVCLLAAKYQTASILFHYHAPVLPFLFFALPFGVRAVYKRVAKYAHSPASCSRGLAWAVVAASLIASVLAGKSPLSLRFYDRRSPYHYGNLYMGSAGSVEARRTAESIPRDASVCASEFVAPLFTHHANCWTFPNRFAEADVIVVARHERWFAKQPDAARRLHELSTSPCWHVVSDRHGIVVYQRGAKRGTK